MRNNNRRTFMKQSLMAATYASVRGFAAPAPGKLGSPGPYRGRVVSVFHPASMVSDAYQREPVRQMLQKGMMELTGAGTPAEAWRVFFEPGDVVGIKLNPVGNPYVISSAEVVQEIIEGLKLAGIKPRDIVTPDAIDDAFALEVRSHAQQLANGDDAGATNAGDHDAIRRLGAWQLRLRQHRQAGQGRNAIASFGRP